jgi:hypothetical protein
MEEDVPLNVTIGMGDEEIIEIYDEDGSSDHSYSIEPGPSLTLVTGEVPMLVPDKDWSGVTWIDLKVRDNTGTYEKRIDVNVHSKLDDLVNISLVLLGDIGNMTEDDRYSFEVRFEDPDEGDYYIEITWSIDENNRESWMPDKYEWLERKDDNAISVYLDEGPHWISVKISKMERGYYGVNDIEVYVATLAINVTKGNYRDSIPGDHEEDRFISREVGVQIFLFIAIVISFISVIIFRVMRSHLSQRKGRDREVAK